MRPQIYLCTDEDMMENMRFILQSTSICSGCGKPWEEPACNGKYHQYFKQQTEKQEKGRS